MVTHNATHDSQTYCIMSSQGIATPGFSIRKNQERNDPS